MRQRYFAWDDDLVARLLAERDLMRLFNYLLLQSDGDAEQALQWLAQLQRRGRLPPQLDVKSFAQRLRDKDLIRHKAGRHVLTSKGEHWLRQESLDFIFQNLKDGGNGAHPMRREGQGPGEALPELRPWQPGDGPQDLDLPATWRNALTRRGLGDEDDLAESDLAVHEREASTSAATVLLLDISHSMVLYGEDRITPAKQVALAMAELIKTRYPKDSLDIVTFGDEAKVIRLEELAYVGVGPYHTNTQEGLKVGRELLLRRKCSNRQIFMITDGKPSVVRERNGELYLNSFGLDPHIVSRTLEEAILCRRKGIVITTFMIASDPYLQDFVRRLTELNQGRAYFSPLDRLGGFIFRDFMSHRARKGR
jgi:Ca-activated chloride channel homolog